MKKKKFKFLKPNCDGDTIRIGRDIQCLPYAIFFYTNNMHKEISKKWKLEQQLGYVRMKQVVNIPEHKKKFCILLLCSLLFVWDFGNAFSIINVWEFIVSVTISKQFLCHFPLDIN